MHCGRPEVAVATTTVTVPATVIAPVKAAVAVMDTRMYVHQKRVAPQHGGGKPVFTCGILNSGSGNDF